MTAIKINVYMYVFFSLRDNLTSPSTKSLFLLSWKFTIKKKFTIKNIVFVKNRYSAYFLSFWRSYDEKKNRHTRRHKILAQYHEVVNAETSSHFAPVSFKNELSFRRNHAHVHCNVLLTLRLNKTDSKADLQILNSGVLCHVIM